MFSNALTLKNKFLALKFLDDYTPLTTYNISFLSTDHSRSNLRDGSVARLIYPPIHFCLNKYYIVTQGQNMVRNCVEFFRNLHS